MYLRAGVFSLGLLLLSRALGLLRESVQAAAFGATGLGDAVIVMFTLPDLLVGVLVSGALSYVLLPAWAQQSPSVQAAGQKKVAYALALLGLGLGLLAWLFKELVVQALAPGLSADMKTTSAQALIWSALVLPLAMLAALWVTRLQHERDFVGMYAGNLIVNLVLIAGLWAAAMTAFNTSATHALTLLGVCLVLAMLARLAWLAWRLPARPPRPFRGPDTASANLPTASVWVWAALSSGLLLVFPLAARSLASATGEGALASFNYAWKLIELPLVLAVQLVASLAFPAITRTEAGTHERQQAISVAFLVAWALACAAAAVVASFSLPIASLLFGWGRMSTANLSIIADWSAVGIWSLLPQALMAVLLTVMATTGRMHTAVWVYALGLALLLLGERYGGFDPKNAGANVMWLLNAIYAGMTMLLFALERHSVKAAIPYTACLAPLLTSAGLVALKPFFAGLNTPLTLVCCAVYGLLVTASAVAASRVLRGWLHSKLSRQTAATST